MPLTFFSGIGGASRRGILVKGANYLDVLAKVDTVVFDKTGTLTRGQFSVTAVHPEQLDAHELLHLAAHVEHFITHPIGAALRDAFPDEATDGCTVEDVTEVAGKGITAKVGADSAMAITQLRDLGVTNVTMLTGDRRETAATVAAELEHRRLSCRAHARRQSQIY